MSACVSCKKEILDEEYMVDGSPAVCAWVPFGAGRSVHSIVAAHVSCMTAYQLRQAINSLEKETTRLGGMMPEIQRIVERRLSELLATDASTSPVPDEASNIAGRFSLLEVD